MSTRLHTLADNHNLTEAEYAAAALLIGGVRELHLGARDYVQRNGLDPEIFLPGNIWGEISNPDGFINWSYLLTNFARGASPFSGIDMIMWGRRDAGEVDPAAAMQFYDRFFGNQIKPEEMDAELDRLFNLKDRMRRSAPKVIGDWEDLVKAVPESFRWSPPPRAGEIGILHRGRIINPDLLYYQSRINALHGAGVLDDLERTIADRGSANYLEIGPGSAYFAHALRGCLGNKLNVYLIDITQIIANGCAYLSCAAGADQVTLAMPDATGLRAPYVYLANYLTELYRARLPKFDLVHNAISLNEMNAAQVSYYLNFIADKLAPEGVFYLTAGHRLLDYHQDAFAAARARFPNHVIVNDPQVGKTAVIEWPNSFFRN